MVEIYSNFILEGFLPAHSRFTWTRRFSHVGEFKLETKFTQETFHALAKGRVLYKRDVDEAAFVERRMVVENAFGELLLIVEGRHLSSLLDRRVVSVAGDMTLAAAIDGMINNNFMSGAGNLRSMQGEGLRFMPRNIPSRNVSIEHENVCAERALTDLCEEHGVGIKVRYNISGRTFDLHFLNPVETDVAFSKNFGNVFEQSFLEDTKRYKNVVYVENEFIHNNEVFRGMERREMAIPVPRQGQTHFLQSALDALHDNRAIRTLSSTVNPHSEQFVYLKDWNLGSVVFSKSSELEFTERGLINEIVEIYGEEGLALVVNIGSITRGRRL